MDTESFIELISQKSPRKILRSQMAFKDAIDTPLALRDAREKRKTVSENPTSAKKTKSDGLRQKVLRRRSIQIQEASALDSSILIMSANKTYADADISLDSSNSSVNGSINMPHNTRFKSKRKGSVISASQPEPRTLKSSKNDLLHTKKTLRSRNISTTSTTLEKELSLPLDNTYSTVNASLMDSSNDSINLSSVLRNKRARGRRTTVTLSQPNPTLPPIISAKTSAPSKLAEDSYASLNLLNSSNESLESSILKKKSEFKKKNPKRVINSEFTINTNKVKVTTTEKKDNRLIGLLAGKSPKDENKKISSNSNRSPLSRSLLAESGMGSDSSFETSKIEFKRKFIRRTSRTKVDLMSILNKARQNANKNVLSIPEEDSQEDSEAGSRNSISQACENVQKPELEESIDPFELSDELSDASEQLDNDNEQIMNIGNCSRSNNSISTSESQDVNQDSEIPLKHDSVKSSDGEKDSSIPKIQNSNDDDKRLDVGKHSLSNDFKSTAETHNVTEKTNVLYNVVSEGQSNVGKDATFHEIQKSNDKEIPEMCDSENTNVPDTMTSIPETQDSESDSDEGIPNQITLIPETQSSNNDDEILETQCSNQDDEALPMFNSKDDSSVPDKMTSIPETQDSESDSDEGIPNQIILIPETQSSNNEDEILETQCSNQDDEALPMFNSKADSSNKSGTSYVLSESENEIDDDLNDFDKLLLDSTNNCSNTVSKSYHDKINVESQSLNKSSCIKKAKDIASANEKSDINYDESPDINNVYLRLSQSPSQEKSPLPSSEGYDLVPADAIPPPLDFRNEEEKENTPANSLEVSFSSADSDDDGDLQSQIADSIASLSDDSSLNSPLQELPQSHLKVNSPLAKGGQVLAKSPYKVPGTVTPIKNTKLHNSVLSSNKNVSLMSQFTTPERKRKSFAFVDEENQDLVTPDKSTILSHTRNIPNNSHLDILQQTNYNKSQLEENRISKNSAENLNYSKCKSISLHKNKDSFSNLMENTPEHFVPQSSLVSPLQKTTNMSSEQRLSTSRNISSNDIIRSIKKINMGNDYDSMSDLNANTQPINLRLDETELTEGTKQLSTSRNISSNDIVRSTKKINMGNDYDSMSDLNANTQPINLRLDETELTEGTKQLSTSRNISSNDIVRSTKKINMGTDYDSMSDLNANTQPINLRLDETELTEGTKQLNLSQQLQLKIEDSDVDSATKVIDKSRNTSKSQLKNRSVRKSTGMSQSLRDGDISYFSPSKSSTSSKKNSNNVGRSIDITDSFNTTFNKTNIKTYSKKSASQNNSMNKSYESLSSSMKITEKDLNEPNKEKVMEEDDKASKQINSNENYEKTSHYLSSHIDSDQEYHLEESEKNTKQFNDNIGGNNPEEREEYGKDAEMEDAESNRTKEMSSGRNYNISKQLQNSMKLLEARTKSDVETEMFTSDSDVVETNSEEIPKDTGNDSHHQKVIGSKIPTLSHKLENYVSTKLPDKNVDSDLSKKVAENEMEDDLESNTSNIDENVTIQRSSDKTRENVETVLTPGSEAEELSTEGKEASKIAQNNSMKLLGGMKESDIETEVCTSESDLDGNQMILEEIPEEMETKNSKYISYHQENEREEISGLNQESIKNVTNEPFNENEHNDTTQTHKIKSLENDVEKSFEGNTSNINQDINVTKSLNNTNISNNASKSAQTIFAANIIEEVSENETSRREENLSNEINKSVKDISMCTHSDKNTTSNNLVSKSYQNNSAAEEMIEDSDSDTRIGAHNILNHSRVSNQDNNTHSVSNQDNNTHNVSNQDNITHNVLNQSQESNHDTINTSNSKLQDLSVKNISHHKEKDSIRGDKDIEMSFEGNTININQDTNVTKSLNNTNISNNGSKSVRTKYAANIIEKDSDNEASRREQSLSNEINESIKDISIRTHSDTNTSNNNLASKSYQNNSAAEKIIEDSDSDTSIGAHNILNHSHVSNQDNITHNVLNQSQESNHYTIITSNSKLQDLSIKNISHHKEKDSIRGDNDVVPINTKQMTMRDFLYNLSKKPMVIPSNNKKQIEKNTKLAEKIIQSSKIIAKTEPIVKKKSSKAARKQAEEPSTYPPMMIKTMFTHFSKLPVHKDALKTVALANEELWKSITKHLLILLTTDGKGRGNRKITEKEIIKLMKRQKLVTSDSHLSALISEHLPDEMRRELIPTCYADNIVYPQRK